MLFGLVASDFSMDSSAARREHDASKAYEASAAVFMAGRSVSTVGAATVRSWAHMLPRSAAVIDLGCGHGVPISQALIDAGLLVWGVDASPTMTAAFRARFPESPVLCEPVERSQFFGRQFDGAVAWGLMFLLPADVQLSLIHRLGTALNPGGRLLFTAPWQECRWADNLTGCESISLGRTAYVNALSTAGFDLVGEREDEGENHYFDATRRA